MGNVREGKRDEEKNTYQNIGQARSGDTASRD